MGLMRTICNKLHESPTVLRNYNFGKQQKRTMGRAWSALEMVWGEYKVDATLPT